MRKFFHRAKAAGQSLPEYGLVIALVTLVCVLPLTQLGQTIFKFLNDFASQFISITSGG